MWKWCHVCWLRVNAAQSVCPQCGRQLSDEPLPANAKPIDERSAVWTKLCDNCGSALPADVKVCPTCGRDITVPQNIELGVWPPGPYGEYVPQQALPPLCTKSVGGDIAFGVVTALTCVLLAFITFGIALVGVIVLYCSVRTRYPVYTRGMNYGFIAAVFILLAPCLMCITGPHTHPLTRSNSH